MIKTLKHKYFYIVLLFIIFTIACSSKKNIINDKTQNKITLLNIKDTLKFKSGIRSIFQDSKGNYWFGSDQEGVCKYDGKTLTYYTFENGFCGKQVISIQEDETGLIWFATSSGLCYFDGTKFTTSESSYPTAYPSTKYYSKWKISSTDLWFPGKFQNELIRIENGKSNTIEYPIQIPLSKNRYDTGITGFSKSKKGGLWIAHYSGVNYYNGKTILYINDSTMLYDGKSKYMHVRSILEDSKGRVWIGNNGIGVQLIEKDSIIHFSEKHNLFKGDIYQVKSPEGTLMHVFAIKEDSKGNIWFGDRDTGAWRFDGKEIKNFILDPKLKTQHIWDIFEDTNGHLLFASGDNGIYKFSGKGFDKIL